MPSGGYRPGAGRKPGVPNKASGAIKELAQVYGPAAIARLAQLSGLTSDPPAESEQTQLGAMRELLDRGYGKAAQAITGADGGAIRAVIEVVTGVVRGNETETD